MGLELTNIQATKSVVLLSEEITVTFTVVNNTGAKVTVLDMGAKMGSLLDWFVTDLSVSIADGASKTYSYAFAPSTAMKNYFTKNPDTHSAAVSLYVSTYYSDGTAVSAEAEFAEVYDGYYAVGIDALSLTRCTDGLPDDEGESVLLDIQISLDDGEGTERATMKLYYAEGDSVDESCDVIDLTEYIEDAKAGIDGAQILTQEFSNGSDWAFLLVLHNGWEAAAAYVTLGRAFANVHLSGASTGGVAFGKFSAAEEGAPLFECAYPSRLQGVNIFTEDEVLTGGVWMDGKPLYRKMITVTSSATGTLDTDVSALGFEYVRIAMDVICYKYGSNDYIYWADSCWNNSDADSHRAYLRGDTLRISTGTSVKRQAEYVLLEYTKAD